MTIKIDHINLTVANLKESTHWYKEIFGFELVESGITPLGVAWGILASNDSMICMSEYKDKAAADKTVDRSTHRIYHFGIRISHESEWQKIVREHCLKLYYGGEVQYSNSKSWYIHDPSGHEIEVSFAHGEALQFPNGGGSSK